jgi:hypothetical protein
LIPLSEQDKNAILGHPAFLGQIATFTITDTDLNLENFRLTLKAHDLNDGPLRKKLRPVDAFKRACNDVAIKYPNTKTEQRSFLVRQAGHDRHELHRHIIHERIVHRTGQTRRVEHHTITKLIYDRGFSDRGGTITAGTIYAEPVINTRLHLTGEEEMWLSTMVGDYAARLKQRYGHYSLHLDSHGFRTFVRDYLHHLDAVGLKGESGGFYFVRNEHAGELRRLAEVVRSAGSRFWMVPLVDTADQMEMLTEAFMEDMTGKVTAANKMLDRLLRNEHSTITKNTYDKHMKIVSDLGDRLGRYKKWSGKKVHGSYNEVADLLNKTLKLSFMVKTNGLLVDADV